MRLDLGEGFLELGLVLCSLYFMARNNLFPIIGVLASVTGIVLAVCGWELGWLRTGLFR